MKSGILAIHKPEGISSAKVVAMVKRHLKAKKLGHTGTLDPFATGLLLCAVNKATRISRFFLNGHKRYTATIRLGVETDTYDKTGQVVSSGDPDHVMSYGKAAVEEIIRSFSGVQQQEPPIFSALKHQGQPLYKLARKGVAIKKPARSIEIFDIQMTRFGLPFVDIDVHCSSGTYIRTIAHDIGRKLGCGAHLTRLCRTQTSQFVLESAMDLSMLEALDADAIEERIVSLSEALPFLPKMTARPSGVEKIKFGRPLLKNDLDSGQCRDIPGRTIRVVDENGALLALVEFNESGHRYDYSCVFAS